MLKQDCARTGRPHVGRGRPARAARAGLALLLAAGGLATTAGALPNSAVGSTVVTTAATQVGGPPDFSTISGATTTIEGTQIQGGRTNDQISTVFAYANSGEQVAMSFEELGARDLSDYSTVGYVEVIDPTGDVVYHGDVTGVIGTVLGGSFTSDTSGVWSIRIADSVRADGSGFTGANLGWNIGVLADDTTAIAGRVFSEAWAINQTGARGSDPDTTDLEFFALNAQGAQYRAALFDYNGVDSTFAMNNVGNAEAGTCESVFESVPMAESPEDGNAGAGYWQPTTAADCEGLVSYQLFLDSPDANIGTSAVAWADGRDTPAYYDYVGSTDVADLAFERSAPNAISGTLTGTTNQSGTVTIRIDADGNGSFDDAVDVVDQIQQGRPGPFNYAWDGLDANGDAVPVTTEVVFEAELSGVSPIHIVRVDAEINTGGLEVEQLVGPDAGSTALNWDDSRFGDTSDGRYSTTPVIVGDEVESTGGVHGWDNDPAGRNPNANNGVGGTWSDFRAIDDWAFIDDRDMEQLTLAPLADIRINKTAVDAVVSDDATSATVTWTVEVGNFGPVPATETVMSDTYPEQIDPATVEIVDEPTQGTFDAATGEWAIGTLEPGQEVTITFSGTAPVTPGESTTLVNGATVTSPEDPYVPGDECQVNEDLESDTDQCDVVETPIDPPGTHTLQVDKETVSDGPYLPGETIEYELTALNGGNVSEHDVVVVEDPISGLDPATATVVGEPSQGTFDAESLTWTVGTLEPGQSATITLSFTVADPGEEGFTEPITNGVTIENPENPYEPGDCIPNDGAETDTDQCDSVVDPVPADLRIVKEYDEDSVDIDRAGGTATIAYDVTVGNFGPGIATDVVMTDILPEGSSAEDVTLVGEPDQGNFEGDTWTIGDLAAGESVSVTFEVVVPLTEGEQTIVNTATVTSPEDPYEPGDVCQDNTDLESDTDQCDVVETPVELVPLSALAVTGMAAPWVAFVLAALLLGAGALFIRPRKIAADSE